MCVYVRFLSLAGIDWNFITFIAEKNDKNAHKQQIILIDLISYTETKYNVDMFDWFSVSTAFNTK